MGELGIILTASLSLYALAATVFHSGQIRIPDLKGRLSEAGIGVRPC